MKHIVVFLLTLTLTLHAQQVIIKAAQDVKYLSQQMANDYLLYFYNPRHFNYAKSLQHSLQKLKTDLRTIATNTNNEDIRSVLDYLSYTKDEIADILQEKVDKARAEKMLDFSQTLQEGAGAILETLGVKSRDDVATLRYHIIRLSTFYLAKHLHFDETENTKAISHETVLIDMMSKKASSIFRTSWIDYKRLYQPSSYFLPHLVSLATDDLCNKAEK